MLSTTAFQSTTQLSLSIINILSVREGTAALKQDWASLKNKKEHLQIKNVVDKNMEYKVDEISQKGEQNAKGIKMEDKR